MLSSAPSFLTYNGRKSFGQHGDEVLEDIFTNLPLAHAFSQLIKLAPQRKRRNKQRTDGQSFFIKRQKNKRRVKRIYSIIFLF